MEKMTFDKDKNVKGIRKRRRHRTKQIVSILIAILTVTSLLPMLVVETAAAPQGSSFTDNTIIAERIDAALAMFPSGSYFTKNGKSCSSCHGASVDCVANESDCNCIRYVTIDDGQKVDLLAVQCLGYARYWQQILFGCFESNMSKFANLSGPSSNLSYSMLYVWLYNNQDVLHPGTHLRVRNDSHSVVLLGFDLENATITFVECNWDLKCGVEPVRTMSFDDFATRNRDITYAYVYKDYYSEYPDYETAYFPMKYLNITQGVNGSFSHQGTKALDLAGKDTGKDAVYAPFTGIIKRIYTHSGNFVWLESCNPVRYADGTVDYMTIMIGHDNDVSDLYVGKIVQQGEHFYNEGDAGYATGNHIHLECARGKYTSGGWYENSYGNWAIHNAVLPYDALVIKSDVIIKNSYGYNWKNSPHITPPIVPATVPDGTYYFSSHEYSQEEHSHMYMKNDSGSNNAIGLSGGETDESAKFEIKKDGEYYLLQPTTTQKGYVVATYWSNGSSTQSGDVIALWENDGDLSQRWIFEEFEGGYVIRPADNTGLAWTREGGKIILRPFDSYSSQVWTLEDASVCVHDYQYKADAEVIAQSNHWKECTKCGDIIEYRNHSWDIVCLDNRIHAAACKVCGVVLEKDLHYYSSVCDTSCNACDYLRDASHSFQVEYDSTQHWEVCIGYGCDLIGEKTDHIYQYEIKDGYKHYSCVECAYTYKEAVDPPPESDTEDPETKVCTEHSYGSWEMVRASTCTAEGEERQVCTECGHTNSQKLPMVSHEYGDWYEGVDEEGRTVIRSDCKNCSMSKIRGEGASPSTEPVQETDTDTTDTNNSPKPEEYFGCLGSLHASAPIMVAFISLIGLCVCRKKKD